MELTKEHFDQIIARLVTKEDLSATEERLLLHVSRHTEELARMVNEGFTDVQEQLGTRNRMETLEQEIEQKFRRIEEVFKIRLS